MGAAALWEEHGTGLSRVARKGNEITIPFMEQCSKALPNRRNLMLRKIIQNIPRRNWLMLIPLGLGGLYFYLLERIALPPRYILYSPLDDLIPFTSAFIIPYVIWYFYVAGMGVILFFKDSDEFVRFAAFLSSGMLIACIIYTLWPNGQMLRPDLSSPLGPLEALIQLLYTIDTPTNSSPSIHVVYSIATHGALTRFNRKYWQSRVVHATSLILAILIILSTVFVKQHSVICVVSGLLMALILYAIIYGRSAVRYYRAQKAAKAAY
jgi:membrane-associated phospholipid phosphatase